MRAMVEGPDIGELGQGKAERRYEATRRETGQRNRPGFMRFIYAALVVNCIVAATHVVSADAIVWQGGTGDWFDANNWVDLDQVDQNGNYINQVPGASDTGNINNGGEAQISGGSAAAYELFVAGGTADLFGGSLIVNDRMFVGLDGSTGNFNQSDGTNTVSGFLDIGDEGAAGTYTLSGAGSVLTAGSEYLSGAFGNGTGNFNQSGGKNTVGSNGFLYIANGTYTLSGTGSLSADIEDLGGYDFGTGYFSQSAGTNIAGSLTLGGVSSNGTYTLSGTGSLLVTGSEALGAFTAGTVGIFNQYGGTHRVNGTLTLAEVPGSSGTYNMQGGTLTAASVLINAGGTFTNSATMTLTGGTGGISNGGTFTQNEGGNLNIQINGSGNGQFGQLSVGAAQVGGSLYVTFGSNYTSSNLPAYGSAFQILSTRNLSGTFGNAANVVPVTFAPNIDPYSNNGAAGLFNVSYASNGVTLSGFHQVDYLGIGVNFTGVNVPGQSTPLRGDLDVSNMENVLFHQTAEPIELNATSSYATNLGIISTDFSQFQSHFSNGVGANDTIVVELSSHGGLSTDGTNTPLFQISGANGTLNSLDPSQIANAIGSLPQTAQKIVLIDCCDSAGFLPALEDIPNIAVLTSTAGTGDPEGNSYSAGNGTGLFSDAIESELNNGVYNLADIEIDLSNGAGYGGDLIGEDLDLRDTGTAVFGGMEPELFESSGFNTELIGPPISVPEPVSVITLVVGAAVMLSRRCPHALAA